MIAIAHELLEAAVRRMPEDALTPARKAALVHFATTGFPTVRDEDWKYTNLRHAVELTNTWLGNDIVASPESNLTAAAEQAVKVITENIDAYWIVVANGIATVDTMPGANDLQSNGISITKLSQNGTGAAIIANDPMTSFNAALLQDGLRVRIQPSANPSKPLAFMFVDQATQGDLSQARLIIDVDAGATIDLIDAPVSVGSDPQFANTVILLRFSDSALVGFVRPQ